MSVVGGDRRSSIVQADATPTMMASTSFARDDDGAKVDAVRDDNNEQRPDTATTTADDDDDLTIRHRSAVTGHLNETVPSAVI